MAMTELNLPAILKVPPGWVSEYVEKKPDTTLDLEYDSAMSSEGATSYK